MNTTDCKPCNDTFAHLSSNARYEQKRKLAGDVKITLWVPDHCAADFKDVADHCCDNRDLIPAGVRSISTGRLVKV